MALFLQAIIQRFEIIPTATVPEIKPLVTLRPDEVILGLSQMAMTK